LANVIPVPPSGGSAPTPLTAGEASAVQLVANLNPQAGAAMTFFADGSLLGTDFANLGAAISGGQDAQPFVAQTVTDMKQLLTSYLAAMPSLAAGVSVPGGPTLAIPAQFATDVVSAGLKALMIGDAGLDRAYAGALNQFFGTEQAVLLTPPP
jgi:hypothetical protein